MIFKESSDKNTLVDVDHHKKKGWKIGNLTLIVKKDSKKSNRLRNLLISEFRVLPKGFTKSKKKSEKISNSF
jgi:hypothetical protein